VPAFERPGRREAAIAHRVIGFLIKINGGIAFNAYGFLKPGAKRWRRPRTIGNGLKNVLRSTSAASSWSAWTAAFARLLGELGWIEQAHRRDRVSLGAPRRAAAPRSKAMIRTGLRTPRPSRARYREEMDMKTNIKIAAAAVGGLVLGAGLSSGIGIASGVLHAQGTAPYYEVAEINVRDQAGYEKSGVDKVRAGIKASGGKLFQNLASDEPSHRG
jgi:hypothetical protein